ncbi:MAG: betaine/proline/choline family ABC transporter ATP-binding protein [Acholeplasmataceae bacterium]
MGISISIKDLTVIFGTEKQKSQALKLVDSDLTVEEIKKRTGATVANRNVNFEIQENELFVIVGLSGSGKSTFIRTLNLLNKPTKGEVIVDGRNIADLSQTDLLNYRRKDVSMIFQHFGLFSHRNVLGNVEYPLEIQGMPKEERTKIAMEAIENVGLDGWHLSTIKALSGGMRQRVGLARALTNNPKLLLMDEPYSALDPLIRRDMQNELLALEDDSQRTIVFITHDMNEAFRMGDRIALMKDGEVVQIGTPDQFFKNPASDYVKDFIADVDKSRILKVKNVMRKINNTVIFNETIENVKAFLEEKELDYCYVVGDNGKLVGYVEKASIVRSNKENIETLIKTDGYYIVKRNDYLRDIWNELKDTTYDAPVIDIKGKFRGVIGYNDVLEALAE